MVDFDVAIVGGGMIGLATACGLYQQGMKIAIISDNHQLYRELDEHQVEIRASAINYASQKYFQQIGIWNDLLASNRVQPFDSIDVQEVDGFASLNEHSVAYPHSHLGYIIENQLIQNTLYHKLAEQKQVHFFYQKVTDLFFSSDRGFIQLANGNQIAAKLIIAADGANSFIRQQQKIKMFTQPYKHHAIIATVRTEIAHQACAKQIFYPQGIIAFLPLWKSNESCLVWSTNPQNANRLVGLTNDEFNYQLNQIVEHYTGQCELISERYTFPLIARYCVNTVKSRLILIGDAAHTIHPLAGQGANLGFQDSKQLIDLINSHYIEHHDIGLSRYYRYYQLKRHKDTLIMMAAMKGIQDIFNGNNPIKNVTRGVGMNAINRLDCLKKQIIKYAME
ncbi:FAD-dependent monooxygenase [Frischella perrara]|uniref:FAD-dependent monooxygenase n=1 Tax=Frischella perrara TaxID=1267021 RepID=UPI0023F2507B|nr:FAD-dependent monooxygenase [Frischella perrara]